MPCDISVHRSLLCLDHLKNLKFIVNFFTISHDTESYRCSPKAYVSTNVSKKLLIPRNAPYRVSMPSSLFLYSDCLFGLGI